MSQPRLGQPGDVAAAKAELECVLTFATGCVLLRYADTLRHAVAEQQLVAAEAGGGPQSGKRGGHSSTQAAQLDIAALQHVAEELAVVEQIVVAGTSLFRCSC